MLAKHTYALFIFCLALFPVTTSAAEYFNARFGFAFDAPSNFYQVEQTAENGDGQSFLSADQSASLIAFAGHVTAPTFSAEVEQRTQFARDEGWNITYEAGGQSWGVYSGLFNGQILYVRIEAQCDGTQFASIWLIFDESARAAYEPLTSELRTRLKSNDKC